MKNFLRIIIGVFLVALGFYVIFNPTMLATSGLLNIALMVSVASVIFVKR